MEKKKEVRFTFTYSARCMQSLNEHILLVVASEKGRAQTIDREVIERA